MFTALVAAWFGLLVGSLVLVGRSLSPYRSNDPTPRR
jgi:hypothetical protein